MMLLLAALMLQQADLVVTNARIYTSDVNRPVAEALAHLLGLGQALRTVDLVGTRSYDEVIARVVDRAKTAKPGEWIRGRGWDQNDWADSRFPTNQALS